MWISFGALELYKWQLDLPGFLTVNFVIMYQKTDNDSDVCALMFILFFPIPEILWELLGTLHSHWAFHFTVPTVKK